MVERGKDGEREGGKGGGQTERQAEGEIMRQKKDEREREVDLLFLQGVAQTQTQTDITSHSCCSERRG